MNAERMCRAATIFTLAAAFAALSLGAFAQVTPPGRINYQGILRDASGNPLSGLQAMAFRFYDAASAGTLLWEETYDPSHSPQVTVSGGLFTLALGDPGHLTAGSEALFPNVFALHATVYLAVKVGVDAEMTPRIQVVTAPFALNADTLDGKHATSFMDASLSGTFLDTSSTSQTKAGKLTLNGATDYGIVASGPTAGGFFHNSISSGQASVGYGDMGIRAYGNNAGGFFANLSSSGYASVGHGDTGIEAFGNTMGGNFHGPASGYAYAGYGDYGIWAYGSGSGAGGYFLAANGGATLATDDGFGILANGKLAGGYFIDSVSSVWALVGNGTYKIQGGGTVSFVQNHPTEKDKVIVYACPEGDEVATYTRGTAKLVNGEARVKLGETFQWVTNPDIGLTAHLTPRGKAVPLAVTSLSTTELVVTGPDDVAFDYLVYGLRIGFEETSIVQEKQRESYIPSFKSHRERYAKYPELRAFNSLERFKVMESSVRGVDLASLDMSRAKVLKDAIHEYDPAIDPPVETLLGHAQKAPEGVQVPKLRHGSSPQPAISGTQSFAPSYENAASASGEAASGSVVELKPLLPCFPSFQAIEPGDVIAMDLSQRGYVRRCALLADPLVVGIAAGSGEGCNASQPGEEMSALARVPVATSGILSCKVDAAYGPIREGDLLVASPTPGHAMRADNPAQGTVLGKALEPLASGTGLINVLVMLR